MTMRRILRRWIIGLFVFAAPLASAGTDNRTQQWMRVLQSDGSVFDKARACQQLGEFGTGEAVPALSALLNHNILGAYARAGLERIPGPEASAALREALGQTQGKFLVGVINSLAALRDEKAVTALIALTENPDPQVVKAALLALGRISNDQALPIVRRALVAGPDRFRPDAAAACLLAAEHQLSQGRADVARALYDAVRQARVPESYRIGATRGAIVARKSDQVAFLIQQLRSDEPAIRDVALLTIREVPTDELATALNAEVEGAQRTLQIQLLTALEDCHNTQSLQVLKTKVRSDDPEVRLVALNVLARIGDSDDASTFIYVIQGRPGPEELHVAARSLEQMEGAAVGELILKALRSSDDTEARVEFIQLLRKRDVSGATDELLEQATSSDSGVSIAAFQALKSLAGYEQLPSLIALTKKCRDDSVRDAAVEAVYGASKNSERLDRAGALILKELNASTVATEKECWIRVLASLGYAEALPAITALLQDADQNFAQSTISHLSRWPDPTPINALFEVVEGNLSPGLRRQALTAVIRLAATAADRSTATHEELIGWFRRANESVQSVREKRLLLSGLGRVGHIESVRLSGSYLDDADVKTEAVYAIVNAAEPLVKGPDYKAVEAVLKRISGIQDQSLLKKIANLKRDIESTAIKLGK